MTTDEHMERGGAEVDGAEQVESSQAATEVEDVSPATTGEGQTAEAKPPVRRFYANLADL